MTIAGALFLAGAVAWLLRPPWRWRVLALFIVALTLAGLGG